MEETILKTLDALACDIRKKEEECYAKMAYCNEHKFEMEREAIRYSQQAYNRCWLEVADTREKIAKLMKENQYEENNV